MNQGGGRPAPQRRRRVEIVDPKEQARRRAGELHDQGIPMQLALTVAYGRMTLNEALERMARGDKVGQLMTLHGISRALATQIALGQASLDQVLLKRRFAQYREENRDHSGLVDALQHGHPVMLSLHGGERAQGVIIAVEPYTLLLRQDDATAKELHKLQLQYLHGADDWKLVRKGIKKDKAIAALAILPAERPQDRYTCSDKRLFRYLDAHMMVQATLIDGQVLKGEPTWFSRYEIGLRVGGASLVLFRHALHELAEV